MIKSSPFKNKSYVWFVFLLFFELNAFIKTQSCVSNEFIIVKHNDKFSIVDYFKLLELVVIYQYFGRWNFNFYKTFFYEIYSTCSFSSIWYLFFFKLINGEFWFCQIDWCWYEWRNNKTFNRLKYYLKPGFLFDSSSNTQITKHNILIYITLKLYFDLLSSFNSASLFCRFYL